MLGPGNKILRKRRQIGPGAQATLDHIGLANPAG
jgi:hypothetical protein